MCVLQDYPSLGLIRQVLSERLITLVFGILGSSAKLVEVCIHAHIRMYIRMYLCMHTYFTNNHGTLLWTAPNNLLTVFYCSNTFCKSSSTKYIHT